MQYDPFNPQIFNIRAAEAHRHALVSVSGDRHAQATAGYTHRPFTVSSRKDHGELQLALPNVPLRHPCEPAHAVGDDPPALSLRQLAPGSAFPRDGAARLKVSQSDLLDTTSRRQPRAEGVRTNPNAEDAALRASGRTARLARPTATPTSRTRNCKPPRSLPTMARRMGRSQPESPRTNQFPATGLRAGSAGRRGPVSPSPARKRATNEHPCFPVAYRRPIRGANDTPNRKIASRGNGSQPLRWERVIGRDGWLTPFGLPKIWRDEEKTRCLAAISRKTVDH